MSTNLVHYHHPDDDQFSLDFVTPDRDEGDERLDTYDDETETRVRSYHLEREVYVIYTRTNEVADADEIQYSFDTAFAEMDPDTRVIVRETLEVFRRIQERKYDEEGIPLDAYKSIEIDHLPEAFERVDWSGTVPETAGQFASNLVLCHALPNANHRTAFGMLETYLTAVDSSFELPSLATDEYEWQTWVDEYIVDSKRLLTVRRNVGPFQYLQSYGCTTIRRKGGIDISLSEYDLDQRQYEAWANYARKHERRTTKFVETILEKMGYSSLLDEPSVEKTAFGRYIRQLD